MASGTGQEGSHTRATGMSGGAYQGLGEGFISFQKCRFREEQLRFEIAGSSGCEFLHILECRGSL